MKRIKVYAAMLLAAVLAVGFVGCDPKQEDPESWFDILGSNNEAFPTTLNVAYGGYTYDLKISSNLSWTITSDADWVHVDPAEGTGVKNGTIVVDPNTTDASRTATVTARAEGFDDYVINVSQNASGISTEGDAFFVTPEGAGDKGGSTWENAMDVAALSELLANQAPIDGKPIYLKAGTYAVEAPVSVAKAVDIYGGYSAGSTGTDISVKEGETVLDGGLLNSLLLVQNQQVRIEGVTFSLGYSGEDQTGSAITVKGSRDATRLELVDCVLRDNVADDPKWNSCAALSLLGGMTYCENVQFIDNVGANRGAAISMNDATEGDGNDYAVFLDKCSFSGNYLTQKDMWGETINARRGHFYMNNCTLFGAAPSEKGNGCVMNGDAGGIVVNSTFVGNTNIWFVFRSNNAAQSFASAVGVINSLFINNGADRSLDGGDNAAVLTHGWNVFQGSNFDANVGDTETNNSNIVFNNLSDVSKGYYEWTVNDTVPKAYATSEGVLSAIRGLSDSPFVNEFIEWVGEEGFSVDQRGQARNTGKMQPGAYDAGL